MNRAPWLAAIIVVMLAFAINVAQASPTLPLPPP
jgi:hypothetical protein